MSSPIQEPLHTFIHLFFQLMILCLFVQFLLSLLMMAMPNATGNPIFRFFNNITGPFIEPVAKRIPRMSFMMLDLSLTIAWIFTWWFISVVDGWILSALPAGW